MTSTLDNLLSWLSPSHATQTSIIPSHQLVAITSPADLLPNFLFAHLLSRTLKPKDELFVPKPVCFIGCNLDLKSLTAISKKFGVNLATQSGFKYISATTSIKNRSLSTLQQELSEFIELNPDALVIIDSLPTFLWSGIPLLDLLNFHKSLLRQLRTTKSAVVIGLHSEAELLEQHEDDYLVRYVLRNSSAWVHIQTLRSQMIGQMTIRRCPLAGREWRIEEKREVGFKLTETGAQLFAKGTGAGFL